MPAQHVALTRPRRLATGGLGVIHLALAYAYAFPPLSQSPPPATGTRVSIVAFINDIGPLWLIGFGLTGLALLAGLRWPAGLRWIHTSSVTIAAIYSAAIWSGWLLSDPRPSMVAAVLSTAPVAWHIAMADLYSGPLPPRRRRHAA